MDLKVQKNALGLMNTVFDHKTVTEPLLAYRSVKPLFDRSIQKTYFKRDTPESQGIASTHILEYLKKLEENPHTYMHALMIVRNQNVIVEKAYPPYQTNIWDYTFSMCKTLTGLAIGMLCDDGKISVDDPLTDFFTKEQGDAVKAKQKNLTIRHLLTMSSGVVYNEIGAVTAEDWIHSYLDSGMRFDAGSAFQYNSMNSYMLAVIVSRVSGKSLSEFLNERLFTPLHITNYYWEKNSAHIEKGGWGLYLAMEDMAKIGQLFLNDGLFEGQRIISSSYLSAAISVHQKTPESYGNYDYGYQLWVKRDRSSYLMNGMFGQNVIVYPEEQMVIVSTAGNADGFQRNPFFDLTEEYFLTRHFAQTLAQNKEQETALIAYCQKKEKSVTEEKHPFFPFFAKKKENNLLDTLTNRRYGFTLEETYGIGFIPLFYQLVQNNFTTGLNKLLFINKQEKLYLRILENDELYELLLDVTKISYQVIRYHESPLEVAVQTTLTHDEDDVPVLKVTVSFLEYAHVRYMKFFFHADYLVLEMKETPGMDYLNNALATLGDMTNATKLLELLSEKADLDYFAYRIESVMEPRLIAKRLEDLK